eukprot:9702710-Alexandrium_andersonii.AAC.1
METSGRLPGAFELGSITSSRIQFLVSGGVRQCNSPPGPAHSGGRGRLAPRALSTVRRHEAHWESPVL